MPVTLEIDTIRRRVTVTVPPDARWAHMERAIMDAVRRTPELTGWDWIIDDQGPLDDVEVAGMARIGAAFRDHAGPAHSTHTVVVTTDQFFGPWAEVMDHHYGGRRHHAAPTVAAARSLLDRLQSETSGRDREEA